MAKLGPLINGQDVTFDTHQAGDGQETKWRNVHLEKRLHNGGGKIRYPFLDGTNPSASGNVSDSQLENVNREVTRALNKDKQLTMQLAQTVVDILDRFSSGKATTGDARSAAETMAGYFELDENFVRVVEDRAQGRLEFVRTVHFNPQQNTYHQIRQSRNSVQIKQVKGLHRWYD
jgi:hypothetical protein